MAEEIDEENSDELKLAEKLLELTAYFQRNSSAIEKLEASITSWESRVQDLDLQIASKFTELSDKVDSNLKELQNEVNELSNKVDTDLKELQNEVNDQIQAHTELKEVVNEQDVKIGLQSQDIEEKRNEFTKHIENTTNELKTNISTLSKHMSSQFENTVKYSDSLNEGMNVLNQTTDSHTSELGALRDGLKDCKNTLQDLISISKKDQKTHFENFSRMMESFNENIRTEIALSMQTLKESDIKILDKVSEDYMRKKAGEEMQKSVANFYEEIQNQTTKTKDSMTEAVQNSMQEYEKIIEAQSMSITNYKEELERIQGEIQDIIDRKVNEKYEAVFSLLATVTMHAEELMMLVKTAEIHLPQEPVKKQGEDTQTNFDNENSEE